MNGALNGFGDPDPTSARILWRYSVPAAVGLGGLCDFLRWTLGKRGAVVVGLVLGVISEDEGLAEGSETSTSSGRGSVLKVEEERGDVDGQLLVLFVGFVKCVYTSGRRGCSSVDP